MPCAFTVAQEPHAAGAQDQAASRDQFLAGRSQSMKDRILLLFGRGRQSVLKHLEHVASVARHVLVARARDVRCDLVAPERLGVAVLEVP